MYRQKGLFELQCDSRPEQNFKPVNRQVGAFVVLLYDDHLNPRVIESFTDNGAVVSTMQKALKSWKWFTKKDKLFYEWENIIGSISPPQQLNKRGFFYLPELNFHL